LEKIKRLSNKWDVLSIGEKCNEKRKYTTNTPSIKPMGTDYHFSFSYLGKKFIHKAITPFDVDSHIVRPDVIVIALSLQSNIFTAKLTPSSKNWGEEKLAAIIFVPIL
jgi:hypothetical protein